MYLRTAFPLMALAISLLTASAAGGADTGLAQVLTMRSMAQACGIEISRAMDHWIVGISANIPDAERDEADKQTAATMAALFLQRGQVGACYDLRVILFHDGWLH